MSFPSKEEREKCWSSRDLFWKCLDDNGNRQEACVKFREMYENTCPSQWVKHFDRKREYLKFKDRIQKDGVGTSCDCDIAVSAGVNEGEAGERRLAAGNFDSREHELTAITGGGQTLEMNISGSANASIENSNQGETLCNILRIHDPSTSSATKIPSPRIFRRFQSFQPPTYT